MRYLLATTAALAAAGPACAQAVKLTPLAEARARYEHVDQDRLARDADALTLRVRGGVQAASGPWSALVEARAEKRFSTLIDIDEVATIDTLEIEKRDRRGWVTYSMAREPCLALAG